MHTVYAKQTPPRGWPHAIFLAGPTPRDPETPSWRPEALRILADLGYGGVVFVPEPAGGDWAGSYTDQAEWEKMGLEMADKIAFWVPRDLRTMPAFTTNVEFGRYCQSGKAILGVPDGAPKTRYLEWLAGDTEVPVYHDLRKTLERAIKGWGGGDIRKDGERGIPKDIWETSMFQSWYDSLKTAGNRLDEARVLWSFSIPNKPELGVFSYVIWAKVWIAAEGRHKENEWMFARKDIACVVLYRPSVAGDTEVVIVREYRTPSRTQDGFIREVPGGTTDENTQKSALREVHEETGLAISKDRLRFVGSRQAAGTLSTHQVHCYAVELTAGEMEQAKRVAASEETFGEEGDTEMTYVEVTSIKKLLQQEDTDWTTVGLVMRALTPMS